MRHLLFLTVLATGCSIPAATHTPDTCGVTEPGELDVLVRHQDTGEPLPNALVVLQSSSLEGAREAITNEDGLFAFRGLPPGEYTILVFYGRAEVTKVMTLAEHAKARASFAVDPKPIVCNLGCFYKVPLDDESMFSITNETEARMLGIPRTIRRL